ncbi:hypothetical protein PBAL39_12032 [Pedobacter sp. BAL39]|uniref:DUF2931 family protein n=1 Tax=Pedobacter sp. BAL39 TaxID=391596 RepID=UPI0001559E2D|nr:DUF2931 family protein [Pedobacter sp. BAL39]EDM36433.1 hypothetical protein PBAL39_12032 [Pedobacter sp. BAL39]
MKKLNTFNKILLVTAVLLGLATLIRFLSYHSSPRYYYDASVSFPTDLPVRVWTAKLLLEGKDEKRIQTKSVSDGYGSWGFGDSPVIDHKERLPLAVVISYASFRDKAFYRDTIPLPLDTLRSIFETEEARGLRTSIYGMPEVKRFNIVLGIANRGNVVIWIQGEEFERTLLKHHIDAYVPRKKGDDFFQRVASSPKDYFSREFESDSLRIQESGGVGEKEVNYIDTPSHYLRGY